MKGLNVIYCNGCSHSAAGGLEIDRTLDTISVRDYYKERYGVWWGEQKEVSYSSVIGNNFECEVVNEAESGGGSARVIRMAYDFVKKNWKIKDSLFLILELPSMGRLDMYSKKLDSHIILNLHFTNNDYTDDSIIDIYGTRKYYNSDTQNDWDLVREASKSYYNNFFSKKAEYSRVSREINTFLSFLRYHKIKHIFFAGEFSPSIESNLKSSNMLSLKVGKQTIEDFHQYALDTESTIAHETEMRTTDIHPGYFSHKNFGNLLSEYIIENYENL